MVENSLEELVVLFVESRCILAPEFLRLVHRRPFQTARFDLARVFIKRAAKKNVNMTKVSK